MTEETTYKKIPEMSTNSTGAPITVNPKKIPLTWTNEILKELYDFDTSIDAEPSWKTNSSVAYSIDSTTNVVTYEGDGGVCAQTGSAGSSGSTSTTIDLRRWYTVVRFQENQKGGRAGVWIRRTGLTDDTDNTATVYRLRTTRASGTGGLNSGASIHPPAIPVKPVPPPMPTPSFAPAISGGGGKVSTKVKIGDSLKNVFQFKKGKLEVVAPDDDCSDYDTDEFESKAVLTYDPDTGEMGWECTEPSEGDGDGDGCGDCDFCLVRISDPFMPIQQGVTADGRSVTVILPSTL
jgi:hypothetical protein